MKPRDLNISELKAFRVKIKSETKRMMMRNIDQQQNTPWRIVMQLF